MRGPVAVGSFALTTMKRFSFRALTALFGLLTVLTLGVTLLPESASAQQPAGIDVGLQAVGNTTVLSAEDPRTIVVRIINISLGFIGIILVSIIVYAGFLWMTSGGDKEKIDRAQRYIRNAIIGVLIIVSAWAITRFVISSLLGATGGGGGRSTQESSGGGPGGGSFGSAGISGGFYLLGIEPAGSVPIRNVEVRFLFSQDVAAAQVNERVRVTKASGETVAGRFVVEGALATFVPAQACPSPQADRFCFDANTEYVAKVDGTMRSASGQSIACGGLGAVCEGRFRTGDRIDASGPSVSLLQPYEGQSVSQNRSIELIGSASDENGVSLIQFSVDGRIVGRATPAERVTPASFEGRALWNTAGVSLGAHRLQAFASDIDSNSASSSQVSVMVRAESCFNDVQDGDETGPDCGGGCGACAGGACREAGECASGVCAEGRCVERPVITAITPNNGRVGTLVTISGSNFGEAGEVTFAGGVRATLPARCSEIGDGWTGEAVVVEVPVGAQTGPVSLRNGTSGLTDGSDDATGPRVGAYTVNDVARPGLCLVAPERGPIGTAVRLVGNGFGASSDRVQVGDALVSSVRGWNDTEVSLNVPTISPGSVSMRVRVGTASSNPVPFVVEAARVSEPPVIESANPVSGPIGQYVTLRGRNFGDLAGVIQFVGADGGQGPGDTDFPASCDLGTRYWSDTAVTVKVPATIRTSGLGGAASVQPGSYQIYLQRRDGSAPSNRLSFTVATGQPGPGLCALDPDTGPIGTEVRFTGERFGSEQGGVRFQGASGPVDAMSILEWTDQSVRAVVPPGARTGSASVRVRSEDSNALPYTVKNCAEDAGICSATERCCEGSGVCVARAGGVCPAVDTNAHYAWRLSTGELAIYPEVVNECNPASRRLASPSPWNGRPGGTNACVNADVVIRFSTRLDAGQVNGSSVVVRQCASGEGDCAGGAIVPAAVGFPRVEAADADTSLIRFRPGGSPERWAAGSHYQVTLTTAIRSERGVAMPERAEDCGEGNAYCFRFSTRSSAELCAVGSVLVNPATYRFEDIDAETDVHANPLAADDACLQLNPDTYAWNWSVRDRAGRSDARVTVTTVPGVAGQSADQTATARAEVAETEPALATASVASGRTTVVGNNEMSVALQPFLVDSYGPNCSAACVNAAVWAQFTAPVNPATVIPSNLEFRRCADAECRTMDEPFALPTSALRLTAIPGAAADDRFALNRFLLVRPTPLLRSGQTYRVLLRSGVAGGITSARGQVLASLSEERGFAWKFQVKTENEGRCTVDRVTLAPDEKIESAIGARQRFTAVPVSPPDACSETGQLLVSENPYSWSVVNDAGAADASVARLVERTDAASAETPDSDAPIRPAASRTDQQLAEIIATRDPGTGETRLTTNIQATYEERSGRAVYGLQCGQRSELLCPLGSGLTEGGCCAPRPRITARYPAVGRTGICRNTAIFADFQVPVDIGSATATVILAKNTPGVTCPAGARPLTSVIANLPDPAWYVRAWSRIVAFFRPTDVSADVWCVGSVPGTLEVVPQGTGSRVSYTIQGALDPDSEYRIYVRGARDLAAVTPTTTAIRSDRGVVMEQESVEWTFRTGTGICEARQVQIDDTSAESPYLFTRHPETHAWRATAQAVSPEGVEVPIVPVSEYGWAWGPWLSSETSVLSTARVSDAPAGDRADVATNNRNGHSFISARLEITRDALNTPSTSGTVLEASKHATVQLCERPWPGRALGPFTDDADSASLRALAPMFASGPFYHFSTGYCLDAGATTTQDDLPALRLNPVPLRPADTDQGILRQYLFTFEEPALRSDGVGIRIASNPLHLSAARWYAAKGFSGSPQALTVDGYDAVRDGSTVYIAASDLATDGRTVSSLIYIISRNPDAKEETTRIFDQLLQNFSLNVNLRQNTGNVCVQQNERGDARVHLTAGRPVSCSADWECAAVQTNLVCASDKRKLQRDRIRIGDVQAVNASLETARGAAGRYPSLAAGSFIPGLSTSRWPSWEATLASGLGGPPPRDPINRFTSCGRCQAGNGALGKICSENGECGTGQTCVAMTGDDAARNGFDPATCWNPAIQRYLCPAIQEGARTLQTSHVYQYRSIDNGNRYEFSVNLEAVPASSYRPALVTEIRRCTNGGQLCAADQDCVQRDPAGAVRSTGSCRATGGAWRYGGICNNTEYSAASACSAVATGPDQVCRLGQTQAVACTINGQVGTKVQICSDCREFIDGPATVCTPNVQCGNGRTDPGEQCDDGARNGQYGFCSRTCQAAVGSCGDGVLASGETCDNGSISGAAVPGAPGVNGAYCGEGCDVARSCSLDCRATAPHCGDGTVDPSEQCDGNTLQTQKALCTREGMLPTQVCDTNADCAAGWTCGGTPATNACAPVTTRMCSGGTGNGTPCTTDATCGGGRCIANTYPTFHVRSCRVPGLSRQCQFNTWSGCRILSSCGDGTVDTAAGEECDDGISGNAGTGRCTPQCRLNRCGDGFVQAEREDCDFGGRNGVRPSAIEYGSIGTMCTNECRVASVSGGFCGNNILDAGEVCDGENIPVDASCRALGFDYAATQVAGRDALTCSAACSITGCLSCSARLPETPENTITGSIRDAILPTQAIPQARVTLRYNGSVVAETVSEADGRFRFSGLHANAACGSYTLGITLQGWKMDYQTRRLVRTTDPGDGYAPLLTAAFSLSTYRLRVGNTSGADQIILLAPRPGDGETIVMREWNALRGGRYVGQMINSQLLLPKQMSYLPAAGGTFTRCVSGTPGCNRSIKFDGYEGTADLSRIPNARLNCFTADGGTSCTGPMLISETLQYRRASPVSGSVFRYFLVDFYSVEDGGDGAINSPELANKVRVLWRDANGVDQYREIAAANALQASSDCKKYWHVFDQDAVTGNLTVVNRLMCINAAEFSSDRAFSTIADDGDTGLATPVRNVLVNTNPLDLAPPRP